MLTGAQSILGLGRWAILCAGLTACNQMPISTGDTTEVPAHQLLQASTSGARAAGTVTVVVKRSRWIIGSACPARLFVNGQALADLYGGERVTLKLPAGEAVLSARLQGLPCPGETRELAVNLQPGRARTFLFDVAANWSIVFQETAF